MTQTNSARHYLTIVFSDLSESTRIAAAMEPESYAELLGHLRSLFETIVARHDGEIIRIDGDGVLCIFGHPRSHHDAGRRAVEAALDLHGATVALDQAFAPPGMPLRLHTGIHAGIVLLRSGDLVRGRFEVLGDATNIAARLCDQAAADAIIVSEEALGADRSFFSTGMRRELGFDGRQTGLAVYDVMGRESVETRFAARSRRGIAPFAGRRAERRHLADCLARSTGPQARLAAIIGAAGMGKTRLASEFISAVQANGTTVYRGYCESYLGAYPLQPFVQILRAIEAAGGAGPTLALPLARLLAPDAGETGQAPLQLDDSIAALRSLLEALALVRPMILFVDDWQWADDASRRMLEILVETVKAPILFLVSARALDASLAAVLPDGVIEVPPLTDDDAAAAIAGLLDVPEPFVVERICSYAGGSPLFLEELCLGMRQGIELQVQADRSSWLDMMIQSRFERLTARQARLVTTAAAIGHVIPAWLFEALTGVDAADPALHTLADSDFIYPGDVAGTLRFKHGITRDAVYRVIRLSDRQTLHRDIVEALHARARRTGDDEQVEALAHHYGAFGDSERALHYALLAGGKALEVSALDRAQAHYRAALDALASLDSAPDRARQANELTQKYGLSCVFDPSPDQVQVLHRLATLAQARGNAEGLMLAQFWLGAIHYGLGQARPSIAQLERARTAAAGFGNARLYNQITANLGQSYLAAAQCEPAAVLLDAAIAAMRAAGQDGRFSGINYALSCRGFLLADQGHFVAAADYYDQVEALLAGAEPPMFGSYITQVAAVAIWKTDFAGAVDAAERGIALADRTRSRYFAAMSRALRGYARWRASHDPAAIDELVQASQWFLSGASQQRTSLLFGWLAEIMGERGDVARARYYAAKALRRARDGDRLGEATAARAMARLAAAGQARRPVRHYLAIADRSAAARGSPREAALTAACAAELAELTSA